MVSGPGHPVSLGVSRHDNFGMPAPGVSGAVLSSGDAQSDAVSLDRPLDRPAVLQVSPGVAPSIDLQGVDQAGAGFAASGNPGDPAEALIGIDEVQKALNRSRASVYRYTNTDPRNLNPPFNPRKLNPEYRSDQKDPLLFHPNEVARFARDVLRIKEVTVEVLNAPSTATQQLLGSILDELRAIRQRLDRLDAQPSLRNESASRFDHQSRPAA
jgi:hypothetical protein